MAESVLTPGVTKAWLAGVLSLGEWLGRRALGSPPRLLLLCGVTFSGGSTASAQEVLSGTYYAHDPSTIIRDGARYYGFRTDQGIGVSWSTDLRTWHAGGKVFPDGPPSWTTPAVPNFTGFFWAPDVAYFDGEYHLYYSISEWGTIDSAIGLVTTPSLVSPTWTDRGKVIQSDAVWEAGPDTDLTSYNCIDPSILVNTDGTVWMVFGSYSDGILVMPLDPTTGKRPDPAVDPVKIADNGGSFFSNTTEAACLYRRGRHYYLFLNFGGCCSGLDSTYNIRVGRSTSVTGPYLDRDGVDLRAGGGTVLLESTGPFIGPGHAGVLADGGRDWFSFHYYDGRENGAAKLGLAQVGWSADGWPAVGVDWSAFYTFETDAREHLGQFNGRLVGGARLAAEPERGRVLQLDGDGAYVDLPFSVANASTFAAWVKWDGGEAWQRIFDFGDGTERYLFLTPKADDGRMRFAITTGGVGGEQRIEAPSALPVGAWCHAAVVLEGRRGVIYLNGAPLATNSTLTLRPWQTLARRNFVGASQWPDPTLKGRIDSLRIFGRALDSLAIRELALAHPSLAHRYGFGMDASDSVGTAHGSLRGNAGVAGGAVHLTGEVGGYVELPGGLVSGCSAVTLEFWASFGVNGEWARVFDFGRSSGSLGQQYLFFSPHAGGGSSRLEISTSQTTVALERPETMDGQSIHVVCLVDPVMGSLGIYTNGVLDRVRTGVVPAVTGVSAAVGYLGRSLFGADAWLNARIDEFRIYDGRLNAQEIRANFVAGPDVLALPIKVSLAKSAEGLALSWPSYGLGYGLQSSPATGEASGWSAASEVPALVSGAYRVIAEVGPVEGSRRLWRLKR